MMTVSYEIEELNSLLNSEYNKIYSTFPQIQLKGEIISLKPFNTGSGIAFKIKQGNSEFNCVAWRGKCDIKKIIECEHTCCTVVGRIKQDRYTVCKLDLDEDIIKESNDSKIKQLRAECESRGFFENKKQIKLHTIRRLGIISKADTQGYTDFMVQLKVPLTIVQKDIVLEGDNTEVTLIDAIEQLQTENLDAIIIIRGGGSTSDISNAFDKISIYESIKNSSIPIMTAIGHQADKDDKLLITCISDYNFPTPTSAALELNKIIIQPYLIKLHKISNKIGGIFHSILEKKRNCKYDKLQLYYDRIIRNKFGGIIVKAEDAEYILTMHADGNCYKTKIDFSNKVDISKEDIKIKTMIEKAIKSQDIDVIQEHISKLIGSDDALNKCINKINELDILEEKFESANAKEYKTLYCKYDYKKLDTDTELKPVKIIQIYSNTLFYSEILAQQNDKNKIIQIISFLDALCEQGV